MHAALRLKHTKQKVWAPLECQSGLNSDIVMEKSWHPETAPSPIILHSSVKEKRRAHVNRFPAARVLFDSTKLEAIQSKRRADKRYLQLSELVPV